MGCPTENPYDFLNEFDDWFEWAKCVYHYKWTSNQAITHINATKAGWRLCKEGCYGMWRFPNAYNITIDSVETPYCGDEGLMRIGEFE
jgi:hypothetical protein